MSYTPYTAPNGTTAPPTSTYPYSAYHQTPYPGTYPYQTSYATGVTSYAAWPYGYGYVPQHPQTSQLQRTQTQPSTPAPSTPAPLTPAVATTTAGAAPVQTTATVATAPTVAQPTVAQRSAPTSYTTYTPAYASRENITQSTSAQNVGGGGRKQRQSNLKGLFAKDLRNLMYGFGDDRNPSNDTVSVMEEILIEYITDVCQVAGANSKRARLSIEDLRKALSRPADAKKLARLEELLFMQEDIKRARGIFEETDTPMASKQFM